MKAIPFGMLVLTLSVFILLVWWQRLAKWHASSKSWTSMSVLFALGFTTIIVLGIIVEWIHPHLSGTQWALILLLGWVALILALMGLESAYSGMSLDQDADRKDDGIRRRK